MNRLERTLLVTASLVVFGGLSGLPSVLTDWPLNLLALALPGGVCLLIPSIHRTDERPPTGAQLVVETTGPWIGFAIAFHSYYGAWDYQGVGIAILGSVIFAPLVSVRTRAVWIPEE